MYGLISAVVDGVRVHFQVPVMVCEDAEEIVADVSVNVDVVDVVGVKVQAAITLAGNKKMLSNSIINRNILAHLLIAHFGRLEFAASTISAVG